MNLARALTQRIEARANPFNSRYDDQFTIIRGDTSADFESSGRNVRQLGFERHPVVNACVRALSDICALVPLQVYYGNEDGTVEEVAGRNHPAQQLFDYPSRSWTAHDLRREIAAHYVTYGNSLLDLAGNRMRRKGRPQSLHVVHPERLMDVQVDPVTGEIVWYHYRDKAGNVQERYADDIVLFTDLNVADSVFGYPRGAAVLLEITGDTEASEYVRQVVKNHGSPGVVITADEDASNDDIKATEKRFHQKMVNRGGRGGVVVLRGATSLQSIGFDLSQLEFPDLRAVTRESICAAFNVDPRIISLNTAANDAGLSGDQYREARIRLIQQGVVPIMTAIEASLNDWLMPEFGEALVRFDPDALTALTEDQETTSRIAVSEFRAQVRGLREARQMLKLPRDLPDDDELFGGLNLFGEQSPTDEPPDKAKPDDAMDDDTPDDTKGRTEPRAVGLSPEQRRALWDTFDVRAAAKEAPYEALARSMFEDERQMVAAVFDEHTPPEGRTQYRAGEDTFLNAVLQRIAEMFGIGGERFEVWRTNFGRLIGQTLGNAGQSLSQTIQIDFDLTNPLVIRAIDERARELAQFVGGTTADEISSVIVTGREAGMPMRDIAKLVDEAVFEGSAPVRSKAIARTETVGSLNYGEYLAALNSGVFVEAEWLTQGDGKVRDTHADQDGTRVNIGDTFANGARFPGDRQAGPDETINCRCTALYHTDRTL